MSHAIHNYVQVGLAVLVFVVVPVAAAVQLLLQGTLLSGQAELVNVPDVRGTLAELEQGFERLEDGGVVSLQPFLFRKRVIRLSYIFFRKILLFFTANFVGSFS